MNKKVAIVGAVVLILVIGLFATMMMSKKPTSSEVSPVNNSTSTSDNGNSLAQSSIKGLLAAGKTVTCTYTNKDNSGSGTVFVAGSNMRGDFSVTDGSGKQTESHVIQDGNFMYMWSGNQGTKMSLKNLPTPSPTAQTKSQQANLDEEHEMKCGPWSGDQSKFAVPADVKFTDMSAMMDLMKKQTAATPGTQTSSPCDSITDPQAKAACVSAMSGGN